VALDKALVQQVWEQHGAEIGKTWKQPWWEEGAEASKVKDGK